MKKNHVERLVKIGLTIVFFNMVLYIFFCFIYLGLYLNDPDNFFRTSYNGLYNLNSPADVFYFGVSVHCGYGIGDIVARSPGAKAAVSIHVMSSFMLNAGLLLYYVRHIVKN